MPPGNKRQRLGAAAGSQVFESQDEVPGSQVEPSQAAVVADQPPCDVHDVFGSQAVDQLDDYFADGGDGQVFQQQY